MRTYAHVTLFVIVAQASFISMFAQVKLNGVISNLNDKQKHTIKSLIELNLIPQAPSKHIQECSKFFTHIPSHILNAKPRHSSRFQLQSSNNATQQRHSSILSSQQYDNNDDEYDSGSEDDDDENEENGGKLPCYGFGKRWFYWQHYRKVSHHNYIAAKYNNLKEELLANSIYRIEKLDWNSQYKKADVYIKCKRASAVRASGELLYFYYGAGAVQNKEDITIHIQHIIALLFYCNYENLQSNFSASFRVIAALDGVARDKWDNVKKRNREYAIWSRLLREAVELYGDCGRTSIAHGWSSID